jgi:hypothetical protein
MEGEATEIEITPAMIQAGFLALCNSGIADEILEADRVLVRKRIEHCDGSTHKIGFLDELFQMLDRHPLAITGPVPEIGRR